MERESKKAETLPSYMNTFKRLHLNIWTANETKWMNDKEWMDCQGNLKGLEGLQCWGGLDLASTRDITAFVLLFRETGLTFFLSFFSILPEFAAKSHQGPESK